MIKDTIILEKVQRRATKFILAACTSDYKTRLLRLGILPLMHTLDLYDIMFFIKALQQPSMHFNIYNYVSFSASNTRSSSTNKLNHVRTNSNNNRNFYFNRYLGSGINYPTLTLINPYQSLKLLFIIIYGNTSSQTFHLMLHVLIIFVADVANAMTLD